MTINNHFPVSDFIDWLNPKFLYHTTWQIDAESLKKDKELQKELKEKKQEMTRWAKEILRPAFSYCSDDLIPIPPSHKTELDTSDVRYIHKVEEGKVGYQVVTLGKEAIEKARELKANGEYLDYFYWHGFCAALTEALAARVHAMLRVEMGMETERDQSPEKEFRKEYPGKRMSWGYEILPDFKQQNKVLVFLEAEKIGITSTESGMLEPEYSTCAMVSPENEKKIRVN